MAQTTLTIYAGDQLFKSVDFSTFLSPFDHNMEQHFPPVYWDDYWPNCWTASLVYW